MKTGRARVAELKESFDYRALADYLRSKHQGWENRLKIEALVARFFGVKGRNNRNRPECVAMSEILRELSTVYHFPIGVVPGGHGGVYWIATEDERSSVRAYLKSICSAYEERISALDAAVLA